MDAGETGRPRILAFLPQFLPGEKGGGTVQSVAGLMEVLQDEFDFRVVTSDHDLGEREPLPGVEPDVWQERYGGSILYLSEAKLPVRRITEILRKGEFDLIYLNGVFARRFSMLPLCVWLIGGARQVPLILAPRGEFSPGALALKRYRKAAYLALARGLRLYRKVRWHASSPMEEQEILKVVLGRRILNVASRIPSREPELDKGEMREGRPAVMVALDIATKRPTPSPGSWPAKKKGALSVVFLSRISPKKNLDGALRMLRSLRGEVTFTIFGPLEDARYWRRCEEQMGALDRTIMVRYGGILPHADVAGVFQEANLLLFPTHGENFGHVIAEALTAGCPVLISDQTPWRGLEAMRAGWDFPLDEADRFTKTLQECIDMEPEDFETLRLGARDHGLRYLRDEMRIEQHRKLFRAALCSASPRVDPDS
jgi:glycosyltransferase involved in cell wall biosynthesis